jgi:tight adherence protein C
VSAFVGIVGGAWGLLAAVPVLVWSQRRSVARRLPAPAAPVRRARTLSWGPVGRVLSGLRRRRHAAQDAARLDAAMPAAADLLVVAVGAGGAPIAAVEVAAAWAPAPVAAAFRRVLVALELGAALPDALAEMAAAEPLLAPMADVLIAGAELGTPAAHALTRLADEARGRARRRAETRARVLPVKLLFPLVFLVLPAFGLLTVVPALISAMSRL